ncbi:MAG: HEAT repeat domain-containing protein [Myxococcota bacterium]
MSTELQMLLKDLQREAGWENQSGATSAALAAARLDADGAARAFSELLVALDEVDLSEDAGDTADELFRTRRALEAGLTECGAKAIEPLRALLPRLAHPEGSAGVVALRVLARLGDVKVLPHVTSLAVNPESEFSARLAAVEAIGLLRPAGASALLGEVLSRPGELNEGHLKRTAAMALARVGDVQTLEVLLDDPDWYVRLGVVEGLKVLPPAHAARGLARARADVDERVRLAAR